MNVDHKLVHSGGHYQQMLLQDLILQSGSQLLKAGRKNAQFEAVSIPEVQVGQQRRVKFSQR